MLLSIIVPVYNVERFIAECLHSIVSNHVSLDNYEIVVIDDGSPDESWKIVNSFIGKYANIRLIRQENKGLGGARNTGISNAKGDYIWFVDSDDWIRNDSISVICNTIINRKPDAIAITCSDRIENKGDIERFNFNGLPDEISGISFLKKKRFSYCAPFTIYKKEILVAKSLNFEEHLFHEDNQFTPRAYYYLKRIVLLNQPLYIVRQNPESITRSVNFKKNFDLIKVAKTLLEFSLKEVKKSDRWIYNNFSSLCLNSAFSNTSEMDTRTFEEFNKEIKSNKRIFNCFLKSRNVKYFIEGLVFIIHGDYVKVYNNILKRLYK